MTVNLFDTNKDIDISHHSLTDRKLCTIYSSLSVVLCICNTY